mgnify:CR=1 FL=1
MDLTIKFSMDRIKNMDQLYTWTPTYSEELGCPGEEEHYHGTDYCKQVIADVFATMNWGTRRNILVRWIALQTKCLMSIQLRG